MYTALICIAIICLAGYWQYRHWWRQYANTSYLSYDDAMMTGRSPDGSTVYLGSYPNALACQMKCADSGDCSSYTWADPSAGNGQYANKCFGFTSNALPQQSYAGFASGSRGQPITNYLPSQLTNWWTNGNSTAMPATSTMSAAPQPAMYAGDNGDY